jgi:acylphosphatase
MPDLASIHVMLYGRMQGVFFRAYASRRARELGLTGYVRNRRDEEAVEVHAEGEKKNLEELIDHLRIGPPAASVTNMEVKWGDFSGSYSGFDIRY